MQVSNLTTTRITRQVLVSYTVVVVRRAIWSFAKDTVPSWGKGFLAASAALVTLVVSDNIHAFTYGPYYQPATYTAFAIVVLITLYSRKKKWGPSFRKMTAQTSGWILSVIAILLLQFPRNQLAFFDRVQLLSSYNLILAFLLFLLILLPSPIFLLADLTRDSESRKTERQKKRVPTIFNPDFIVHDENESVFDRIV